MKEVSINNQVKLSEHLASPSEAALSHLNELNGVRLSPHFTLGELTKTQFKTEDGNIPSHVAIENLRRICEEWLEELRYSYNTLYCLAPGEDYETSKNVEGIIINHGFRSPQVSKAMAKAGYKPSPTSNHLSGCAVDIRCLGKEQAIRYAAILLDIADGTKKNFDELLIEWNSRGSIWLHFAVRPQGNRRKIKFMEG